MMNGRTSGVNFGGLDDLTSMNFGELLAGDVATKSGGDGKPLVIKISDIDEDPNQPRKEFDEEALREMADSIRVTGVKQPISVRPHPEIAGRWILNFGARRFRGSQLAGRETIPAFVDERCDSFDQVIENEQRVGLSPVEMALFIELKEGEGVTKAEIARRIGKSTSYISKVSALSEMPSSVRAIYDSKKCRDIESLYALTKAYDEYGSSIDAFCASDAPMTQVSVRAFLDDLRKQKNAPPPGVATKPVDQFSQTQSTTPSGLSTQAGSQERGQDEDGGKSGPVDEAAQTSGGGANALSEGQETQTKGAESSSATSRPADPEKVKKPVVMIRFDDRPGRILLDRRCEVGLAWIKYDDDGQEVQVDITQISLHSIVEG